MTQIQTSASMKIHELTNRMISFDAGDPKRISHFLKVHSFAKYIGENENLDLETQFILESAALVHDIGIIPSEKKFHRCDGKIQEQEGPAFAQNMLLELSYTPEQIQRISFLVGHHHTYTNVEGIDYQILIEADFLVNMYEDNLPYEAIQNMVKNVFRTNTGKELCELLSVKADKS